MLAEVFHNGPLSLDSNYARRYRKCIASLASAGAITNIDLEGQPTLQWRMTLAGFRLLESIS